ncbi:MAG TPA: site-2 protease family protein [Phycisphaerae bacterium]|nr:site-2 protease family protein [Phycisphaerae bacterium]
MFDGLMALATPSADTLPLAGILDVLGSFKNYFLIFVGFSLVIFFHELGHFIAAKACGVRVHKFAVGFFKEIVGFTWGETRYSLNILPLGGYLKMLGQEDFEVDKSQELVVKNDPRAFTNKPVGLRMIIVSSGVIMNLIFAAIVFMIVFMMGFQTLPAEVGWIKPGSPAEQVGLRLGDRIVKVNNDRISDQNDLRAAIVLADPDETLRITYERKDPATGQAHLHTVTARPERDEEQNILQLGVAPPMNTTVAAIISEPALPADEQLQVGDEVLEVRCGKDKTFHKVDDFYELSFALADLRGYFAEIKIRRPIIDPNTGEVRHDERMVNWRARLNLLPEGRPTETSGHLLGLVPRVRIPHVLPGERAEQAGFRGGDIIVRWGNQVSPRVDEIVKSVEQNPETEIPVSVLRYRDGKPETDRLTVRPKVPGLFAKRRPTVGIGLEAQETDKLVIADIITKRLDGSETPAARLSGLLPRGAVITRVNDKPVNAWSELVERFIELAGTEVKISWTHEGQPETSGTLYIPRTLGTTFDLPPGRVITAIDGKSGAEIEVNGRKAYVTVDQWQGAAAILKDRVGKTVRVEFWDRFTREFHSEELAVVPEMVDPWPLRIQYAANDVSTDYKRVMLREGNPIKGIMIGMRKTYYFIVQVYVTMQRMIVTRSMGLEQISGPVGIIKLGSDLAGVGLPVLLYFLALISANLAVINFLPLPIFDGGLFVFLIIEKIKGRPVSLKVQVVTQIIGLALIIGIFLFVTFQDIARLLGWT